MRLTEHQSKTLLSGFGLPITSSVVVDSVSEAQQVAAQIDGPVVIKAQVPFGGRGKAGAVRFALDAASVAEAAASILGCVLKNVTVTHISVEPKVIFERELYAGVTWDTQSKLPVALLSSSGGVDVESNASDRVVRRHIDLSQGLSPFVGREMAASLGLTGKLMIRLGHVMSLLSRAFIDLDATTLEINPLVEQEDASLIALDAHVEIDDDAKWRQLKTLEPLGPIAESGSGRSPTPLELEAVRIDAMDHRGVAGRVVEFDGNMALLIGGGGASLTVFDAIQRYGGKPANYCEVGGNPTAEKVAALTELLLHKPGVQTMAVIMNVVNNTRADVMAQGLLQGLKQAGRDPQKTISVFRIPGSWESEAVELLEKSGVKGLGREISLDHAARLAVERSVAHVA